MDDIINTWQYDKDELLQDEMDQLVKQAQLIKY
jgi:hypothetical protein